MLAAAPPGAKHAPPLSFCGFNSYVRCIVHFFKQATVQSRRQTYTTVKRLKQAAQSSDENKEFGDAVNAGSQKMSVYHADSDYHEYLATATVLDPR
jgi:hypothetical protein